MRILYVGENWYGSCARACCSALRCLGCEVVDLDEQRFVPRSFRRFLPKLAGRIFRGTFVAEFNRIILETADHFRPDIFLAFKGTYVLGTTLKMLRERGVRCYNYYPDRMVFTRGTQLQESLPEYDCVFDTKKSWDGDTERWLKLREKYFVPHGYDPELHRPLTLTQSDVQRYACDVSFVATYSPAKCDVVERLVQIRPDLNLKIWGNGWHRASPRLRQFVQGTIGIEGDQYVRIINAARINLAAMGVTPEAKDQTTTRTYEIPACSGFMLHERTPEVLELYEEGREIACFSSPPELAEKIDYYLAHPEERRALAEAGHRRCVPAYSYDNRMKEILRWHAEHEGGKAARGGVS